MEVREVQTQEPEAIVPRTFWTACLWVSISWS